MALTSGHAVKVEGTFGNTKREAVLRSSNLTKPEDSFYETKLGAIQIRDAEVAYMLDFKNLDKIDKIDKITVIAD